MGTPSKRIGQDARWVSREPNGESRLLMSDSLDTQREGTCQNWSVHASTTRLASTARR